MATGIVNKINFFANPAIALLAGDALGTTLSTSSANIVERVAASTIDNIIDQIILAKPWPELRKLDSSLTAISSHTFYDTQYQFAYQLPADFVYVVQPPSYTGTPVHYSSGYNHWHVNRLDSSGRLILETRFANPRIDYIWKTTDAESAEDSYYTLFKPVLSDLIAARCAAKWAYSLMLTKEFGLIFLIMILPNYLIRTNLEKIMGS